MTARAETMNMLMNSARKKKENRRPEYSVWNPAVSSDSPSGMSNGVRLTSAVEAMMYMMNATMPTTGARHTHHPWA